MTQQAHTSRRRRPLDPSLGPGLFSHAHRVPGHDPRTRTSYVPDAAGIDPERRRGRGAVTNAGGRFEPRVRIAFDDGWQSLEDLPPFRTEVAVDAARKVITRNASPDIPFDRSVNLYRGDRKSVV